MACSAPTEPVPLEIAVVEPALLGALSLQRSTAEVTRKSRPPRQSPAAGRCRSPNASPRAVHLSLHTRSTLGGIVPNPGTCIRQVNCSDDEPIAASRAPFWLNRGQNQSCCVKLHAGTGTVSRGSTWSRIKGASRYRYGPHRINPGDFFDLCAGATSPPIATA